MKRLFLIALMSLAFVTANATGQIHDKVVIDGETWEMPASPLSSLEGPAAEAFRTVIGERKVISTANQRGYVAYWKVERRNLILEKVEILQPNGKMKEADMAQLKKALKKYRHWGKIRAEWITGEVIIGKGSGKVDPARPHAPVFDKKKTISLKKGRIVK